MRKWLTRPSLHRPTATPSDICSYYAKAALSHSVSCVVCLLLCKNGYFNRIVHWPLWVKVHKIFHTCRAPRGLFTVKVWQGVTAENFERIAKNLQFLHLYMQKHALCLPRGGGGGLKVKVERTPCRPLSHGSTAILSVQKFTSVPELLKLRTVGADGDFSWFFSL